MGSLSFALGACSIVTPYVPKDAPSADAIRFSATATAPNPGYKVPYAIVALNPGNLELINAAGDTPQFNRFFDKSSGSSKVAIGVGDVLSLTIFEAQAGGLFLPAGDNGSARAGNFVQIPNQQVDAGGRITIPFAGVTRVAGLTPDEAAKAIVSQLKGRAIDPQVVVSIAERRSNGVSVIGDVTAPTRFFLDPGGIRILDAVARAGGAKHAAYETVATLQRGGAVRKVYLSEVISNPSLNINLEANDTLELSYQPKIYLAFGSLDKLQEGTALSRRFPFDAEHMTLAEGLSRAGGLDPTRADAKSIFLLRMERRENLARMGVETAAFQGEEIPTVYSVDLSTSGGFFEMNSVQLRQSDIIIASDAPMMDSLKFLNFVGTATNIGYQLAYMKQNLK